MVVVSDIFHSPFLIQKELGTVPLDSKTGAFFLGRVSSRTERAHGARRERTVSAERLTTKQAQARAGVSRHVLMRAKKGGQLWAESDNKGVLLWDSEALDRWSATRPEVSKQPDSDEEKETPQAAELDIVGALTTALERADKLADEARALAERAARAEGERDGLRETLAAEKARAEQALQTAEHWRAVAVEFRKAAERAANQKKRFWFF